MGIQRSQEDSWTKEVAKWEHRPVLVNGTYIEPIPVASGGKGGAPFQEYPKMLYQADEADGGPRISRTKLVDNEQAERMSCGSGWSVTQEGAIDQIHARHLEMATAAAQRAHTEQWMSPKAKAEAQAVDESTMQHVGSIPETPIKKRRGRPAKVVTAVE